MIKHQKDSKLSVGVIVEDIKNDKTQNADILKNKENILKLLCDGEVSKNVWLTYMLKQSL